MRETHHRAAHITLDILAIISLMPASSLAPYSLLVIACSDFGRLLIYGLVVLV
jgi:hypothetical protein